MCLKEKPLLVPTNALFGPEGGDKSATLAAWTGEKGEEGDLGQAF